MKNRINTDQIRDLSILIVDDDIQIVDLISKILKKSNPNYYIETADSVEKVIEVSSATYWDTILLDMSIPVKKGESSRADNGLFILDYLIKEMKISVPIIAMTGNDDAGLLEAALDKGAYYFLNKPLMAKPLAAIVKNATKFQLSGFDGLTGLLNRSTFEVRLNTEFERVRRYAGLNVDGSAEKNINTDTVSFLSLIFIDADNFKEINDKYSHLIGDLVLKRIASSFKDENIFRNSEKDNKSQIRNFIRPYDIASRFGGDEFAIFLPETDQNGAVVVAKRLRDILNNVNLSDISGNIKNNDHFGGIKISIGISAYPYPNFVENYSELLKMGDAAMYKSKETRQGEIFGYDSLGNIKKLG